MFGLLNILNTIGNVSVYPKKSEGSFSRAGSFDLSRQMSLLRAATTTRIDEELSPGNITALKGETALLVCTVLNVGDKSVGILTAGCILISRIGGGEGLTKKKKGFLSHYSLHLYGECHSQDN